MAARRAGRMVAITPPSTASTTTTSSDVHGTVKVPSPASRIVTLIDHPKNIPTRTPRPVPSSAMSTDSHRTAARVWWRVIPTARSRPSSRVRSWIDSDMLLAMLNRAMTTARPSSPYMRLTIWSSWAAWSSMYSERLCSSAFG